MLADPLRTGRDRHDGGAGQLKSDYATYGWRPFASWSDCRDHEGVPDSPAATLAATVEQVGILVERLFVLGGVGATSPHSRPRIRHEHVFRW
jgi:hypothetical protein